MLLVTVVAAAALLGACGAETPTPETPLAPLTLWGRVEEAAKNFSDRLWGSDVGQTVQSLLTVLRSEAADARLRVAEYGAEVEQSVASLSKRLRRRFSRDGEELRSRWGQYRQAVQDRALRWKERWRGRGGEEEERGEAV
ncbi:uncharacterized protein LOC107050180 [Gallus gallus]|uniref:uncharacterized protein LOC107050180 n=1 Tax=Gallus gallus TaxID=9031 RepID=UPI001AE7537D|nr:uncharacterized protein LOC107050180 [Gallus gallus]